MPTLIVSENTTGGGVGLVADDAIIAATPTTSHGALTTLQVESITRSRVLIRPVGMPALIPPGSTINSVTLALWRLGGGVATPNLQAYRMLKLWEEGPGLGNPATDQLLGEVCWNDLEYLVTPWQTAGAVGATDSNPTVSSSVLVPNINAYITLPSTPLFVADAQAMLDAGGEWPGWVLDIDDGAITRNFSAHNDTDGQRPIFTFDYSAGGIARPVGQCCL